MRADVLNEYVELWKDYGLKEVPLEILIPPTKYLDTGRVTPSPRRIAVETERPPLTDLNSVRQWLGDCKRCGLCQGRKTLVFGSGSANPKLMFVGEGPGAEEDTQGLPFVGQAGQLLTRIIEAMEFQRDDVYIANVVKCRPPQNRAPLPEEIEACAPFLKAQIEMVKPQVIVALGLVAANALLGDSGTMASLRGQFKALPSTPQIPVMPTYHPAYLLRNPPAKKMVWEDMKKVKSRLEGKL